MFNDFSFNKKENSKNNNFLLWNNNINCNNKNNKNIFFKDNKFKFPHNKFDNKNNINLINSINIVEIKNNKNDLLNNTLYKQEK